MAIELLKQKRAELRAQAKFYNRKFRHVDGFISVKTLNLLRECARLTVAIVVLTHS